MKFVPSPFIYDILDAATKPGRVKVAERIADDARGVWQNDSGEYDRSIQVFTYGDSGVGTEATDPGAIPIEYGSEDTPVQAPIRTAASRHGRFEPS